MDDDDDDNAAPLYPLAGFERPLQGGEREVKGRKWKRKGHEKGTGVNTSRNKFLLTTLVCLSHRLYCVVYVCDTDAAVLM